ncbi:TonB-dependent receptor [Alteromonas ponticola]|uniref:TonB-dependent receptor n=2 Tax=Alteromonas aquimaris TaxID=2998417 RepID=A0ABT3P6M3_9ALTE|nr:TonB-dependent receptor [Alteromonas aquimaris]
MLLSISSLTSYADIQPKIHFSISEQKADSALTEFARQADTTLLFPFELAEKVNTNALNGEFTLQEGLQRLLKGTALAVSVDESGMLSVTTNASALGQAAPAQDETEQEGDENYGLERIAVVGTRNAPRSVTDSSVPLDIVSDKGFAAQENGDVLNMLSVVIPSLNVNDQPINDATSLVRPANLRGMASDHTLLLINGKRRHRSAVITFLGGGLSDGAQGPDISVLPGAAMKQVEVLRDGAAAQYGSDAIAGVINFVLKDEAQAGSFKMKTGEYYEGDGESIQLQANKGFSLENGGFINITAEYRQQQPTSRSVQRTDAKLLYASGNEFVSNPAQTWGALDVKYDFKAAINAQHTLNDTVNFYLFGNAAQRKIKGGFYYRHPQSREGVFVDTTLTHKPSLLIADLDGLNTGIECPQIELSAVNVLEQPEYRLIADNTTALGENCFAFNEWFPGGFTPQFGGTIKDGSTFLGVKGEVNGWLWDASAGVGYSGIDYRLEQTVNPSLGPDSPTAFRPGGVSQIERTLNFDISRSIETNLAETVNIAFGVEWRSESYHQRAGDEASWQAGPFAYNPASGFTQGFSIGSNGFPGYQPVSAGHWTRHNWAMYTDSEVFITDKWELGIASRIENFSDFGSTFDGKVSSRFELNDVLAIRGSASTGFKAPTVGQSNVINVTTAYSANGLEDQATLPPTNAISLQVGATPLTPEESLNTSIGMVATFDEQLYLTLDYFNIRLKDRISTTSAITLTQADIDTLILQGYPEAERYQSVKFFTNDFDTNTQGVDLVIHYGFDLESISNQMIFAYNWTQTKVERVNEYPRELASGSIVYEPNLTPARIRMLEDNLPAHRANLTFLHTFENWAITWRTNYYSSFYEDHLDASAGMDIYASPIVTVDVELGWQLNDRIHAAIGAKNVLDARPDENPYKGEVGALYPPTAPNGMGGGFYYLQLSYKFD